MRRLIAMLAAAILAILPETGLAGDILEDVTQAVEAGGTVTVDVTLHAGEGLAPIIRMLLTEQGVTPVTELLDALSLYGYAQQGQQGVALRLNGADLLMQEEMYDEAEDAWFMTSTMTGGTVVRNTEADKLAPIKLAAFQAYDDSVARGYLTKEQAELLKSQYDDQVAPKAYAAEYGLARPDLKGVSFTQTQAAWETFRAQLAADAAAETLDDGTIRMTSSFRVKEAVVPIGRGLMEDLLAHAEVARWLDAQLNMGPVVLPDGTYASFDFRSLAEELLAMWEGDERELTCEVTEEKSPDGTVTRSVACGDMMQCSVRVKRENGTTMLLAEVMVDGERISLSVMREELEDGMFLDALLTGDALWPVYSGGRMSMYTAIELTAQTGPEQDKALLTLTMQNGSGMVHQVRLDKEHKDEAAWRDELVWERSTFTGGDPTKAIRDWRGAAVIEQVFGAAPSAEITVGFSMPDSDALTVREAATPGDLPELLQPEAGWCELVTVSVRVGMDEKRPGLDVSGAKRPAEMDQETCAAWIKETEEAAQQQLLTTLMENLPESWKDFWGNMWNVIFEE